MHAHLLYHPTFYTAELKEVLLRIHKQVHNQMIR